MVMLNFGPFGGLNHDRETFQIGYSSSFFSIPDQPLMFLHGIAIGHAGEIIADGARPALVFGPLPRQRANLAVMLAVIVEEFLKNMPRP